MFVGPLVQQLSGMTSEADKAWRRVTIAMANLDATEEEHVNYWMGPVCSDETFVNVEYEKTVYSNVISYGKSLYRNET